MCLLSRGFKGGHPMGTGMTELWEVHPTPLDESLPLLLGDNEDIIEEKEVDLLFGRPLREKHSVFYIGCQLTSFH